MKADNWISIKERLPDKSGTYKTLWCDKFEEENEFVHGTFFCLVTHWKDKALPGNKLIYEAAPDMLKALQKIAGIEVWISDAKTRDLFVSTVYPAIEKATKP